MTTSPKVKPLVAFAAVHGDMIWAGTIGVSERLVRDVLASQYSGGLSEAYSRGFRIIKVRIEPVEE